MDPIKKLHLDIPESTKKRVIIVGGGFAGIQMAKGLKGHGFQVVLLDRNNYHTFQPLLYQVATAGLEPDSIAGALRQLFKNYPDFYFRMAKVTEIHAEEQKISTLIGDLHYDYLVIANGSKTNYFGNQEMFNLTFPLKQIPQALNLRSHMLQNFEQTVLTRELSEKDRLTNFVVVGGGPTGVEVSGALGELKKHVLPKDYPDIDFNIMNLHLVDAGPRLLAGMSEKASEKALKYLAAFDVKVKLNTFVKNFDGEEVTLSDGTVIPSKTVIWAAGVKGNIIDGVPEKSIAGGRILVDDFNLVKGLENVFALGDIALMKTEKYPKGLPMLAPVAIQQGKLLARNLIRVSKSEKMKSFEYVDKGSMATVGRNKAVVDMPKFTFGGFFAWLVWMFVHLLSIIGFRNRLVVFSNWVWNYFTYDRGTRLIIRPFVRNKHYKQGESL
ncbi:NAD(P)/FAD-dependent oxidoreductase [Roseivirga echinicomitans]